MRGRTLVAVTALVLGAAAVAQAQSASIALIPNGGYMLGYTLAEDATYGFDIEAAPFIGVTAEYTLSKNLSITLGGQITISQKMTVTAPGCGGGTVCESDATMTMFQGGIILRPMGRTPTGAPTPLYLEAGAGLNMWSFGNFIISGTAFPADDFNANAPYGYVGGGAVFPLGPRAQLQVFGRAAFVTSYSSQGLDDFNAVPPVSTVEGSMTPVFMIGAGLRVGR